MNKGRIEVAAGFSEAKMLDTAFATKRRPQFTVKSKVLTLRARAAVVAVSLGILISPSLFGQTAAQVKALERLGSVHAQVAVPSGVEATSIPLAQPHGLAFDSVGDLFIADTDDNVIREVNLAGVINTVAGNGNQGFDGDGGSATSATLDSPLGVAVDASGNIYIADTGNDRIRMVSAATGIITTIAGTGTAGFGGDGGAATTSLLYSPAGLAVDVSGNIYIADKGNNRIRKITGSTITTVAGNGDVSYEGDNVQATATSIDSPAGVAVANNGDIYIADTHNNRIRLVTVATGIITTIAGNGVASDTGDGGLASVSTLAYPQSVALDVNGNIYIADSNNNSIREIVTVTGVINTVVGSGAQGFGGDSGSSLSATLDTPAAVAVFGTSIAFADTNNQRVRESNGGTTNTVAGVAPVGVESLVLSGPLTSIVYGTGSVTATFSFGGNTATGTVNFYDGLGSGPALIGSATLSGNIASVGTTALTAGRHNIVAVYGGDSNNPAVTSGNYVVVITPLQISATAATTNLFYGQAVPVLTGTLAGVLAQDNGNVTPVFSTTATSSSTVGTYPITAMLSGSAAANYTVVSAAANGSVVIAQASTKTVLTSTAASPVFGAPVTITATVTDATTGSTGTPTGTVTFFDGATTLASSVALNASGSATFTSTTLAVGAHSITATYSASTNFTASTSSALVETVLSQDFTLSASPTTQTALPGAYTSYTLTLTPLNGTFLNAVTLSASGLPAGATATFAPASIASGSGTSTSMLTVITSKKTAALTTPAKGLFSSTALALLLLPLAFTRRVRHSSKKLARAMTILLLLVAVGSLAGCGSSGFFSQPTATYTVTVTAVSGPATHTTNVTLTVQ